MSRNRALLALAITASTVILVIAAGGWPSVVGTPSPAADKGRVLLIAREYSTGDMRMMIEKEVNRMVARLTDGGYSVTVGSQSGSNIRSGNVQLNVDKKLSEIRVEDYIGIIIPCMAADRLPSSTPPEAVEIIRAANRMGMPIAAQYSGVLILGSAGALKDRQYAITDDYQSFIKDGKYRGEGVIRDGNIVTSGICPWIAARFGVKDGTEELVSVFIGMLKS